MSLQGNLSTLGITELLEFLAGRSSSGQLDVTTASGTTSYLLVDGKVGAAEFEFTRGSGTDPAEGTYYVLSELDGSFFFEELDVTADSDGVDVQTLLGRTAGIAEQWHEVEEVISSTSQVLFRNSELDSSVTIKPEWWKTLEVLGEGQSTAQLASHLDLGILDASTQALDMVNAGLLVVSDEMTESNDGALADSALDDSAFDAPAPDEHDAVPDDGVIDDDPHAEVTTTALVEESAFGDVQEESEPDLPSEFLTPDELLIAQAPAPPILASAEPIAEQVEGEAPAAFDQELTAEPFAAAPAVEVMPAAEEVSAPAPIVEPAPLDAAMPEPPELVDVTQSAAEESPALGFGNAIDSEPAQPFEAALADDDGWSTNHFYEDPAPASLPDVDPAPALSFDAPAPAFDAPAPASFDAPAPAFDAPAPAFDAPAASFDAPAPAFDAPAASFDAPIPDTPQVYEPPAYDAPAAPEPNSLYGLDAPFAEPSAGIESPAVDSSAMAGEVMNDLDFLNNDLDSQLADPVAPLGQDFGLPAPEMVPAQATTMPAQASPMPPQASPIGESDPFGSLSDLVVDDDSTDDERGSVLKFLRRD